MSYDAISLEEMGDDKLKLLLHGPPGSGKTTLAASIAEKCKTVVVDLPGEKGLKSIRKAKFKKNIKVIRPKTTDDLNELFWDLQTNRGPVKGAEAVVLESASAYGAMCIRRILGVPEDGVREIDQQVRAMQIQDWGTYLALMSDLATFWFGLADASGPNPMHVIMTSQSKRREDEDSGEIQIGPAISGQGLGAILASPDYIGYCFVEEVETDDLLKEEYAHYVRFGPSDVIATKIHEDLEVSRNFPNVLGGKEEKKRVTIPRLCRTLDITLP